MMSIVLNQLLNLRNQIIQLLSHNSKPYIQNLCITNYRKNIMLVITDKVRSLFEKAIFYDHECPLNFFIFDTGGLTFAFPLYFIDAKPNVFSAGPVRVPDSMAIRTSAFSANDFAGKWAIIPKSFKLLCIFYPTILELTHREDFPITED